MEAVLVLLTECAAQSGLEMDGERESDMARMGNSGLTKVIEHKGKKF